MVVVKTGMAEIARLIGNGLGGTKLRSLALDGNSTPLTEDDTALGSELTTLGAGRKASAEVTKTLETTAFANDTIRMVGSWGLTGSIEINGFGGFNDDAASSGVMFFGDTFADPFFGQSADVIELTVDIVADDKTQDETGRPSQVIPDSGIVEINKLILEGQTASRFSHIAFDDDSTAANQTQTALLAEFTTNGLGRGAATVTNVTENFTNDTAQFELLRNVTGTSAIEGAGLLNESSGGDLGARFVYENPLNLVNTDTFSEIIKLIIVNA